MTTPIKSIRRQSVGVYAVETKSGYKLSLKRDFYAGGWRIWNTDGGPEWGARNYQTKREALEAITKAFDE